MSFCRIVLASLVLVAACDDPLQRQISAMPHDREALRTVPEGSVPVDIREPAVSLEEARDLTNPVPATEANAERGATAYDYYCSHCHGQLGRGWVVVGASLDPAPADFVEVSDMMTDGEIFGAITFGGGGAPPLGPHITVEDRWRIVRHIRTFEEAREGVEPAWGQ